jgi:ribosomal protein L11 methyltransferase
VSSNSTASDTPLLSVAVFEGGEQPARRVADLIAESFAEDPIAVSVVETGPGAGSGFWRVTVYFEVAPDEKMLRALVGAAAGDEQTQALRFESVPAKDWVAESLAGLKPIAAGRFTVHGAHDRAKIPANRVGIEIEAALAFGTGHHGTTRGCLLALDRICKTPRRNRLRVLDLGTGTGVLAIAAARSLHTHVLATDNDGLSVRAARENVGLNRVSSYLEVIKADGVASLRGRGPFDLIFANILLRPLQRFATPLTQLIAPGGRIVLSGILRSQANAALASYHRLTLERRIEIDGWTTLVMIKR